MIKQHLLYYDIIGNDGFVSKEPTLLGWVLMGAAIFAGFALIVFLAA